jgi:RNA polymerase-binding transcription factor
LSEIMTKTRDANLREMLAVRRSELQRTLGVQLREVRASSDHDGDTVTALDAADASNSELFQDIGVRLTEMTAEALARIDDALARIADGTYGVCEECQGEIAGNRLAAVPFATRCRDCQDVHETEERRLRRGVGRRGALLQFGMGSRE